jgi:hypothetical protein
MKIHQLPPGARFEYEGEEYVKTGPLFGTGKAGQRLIPKYAVLKPLDGVPSASVSEKKNADALSRKAFQKAFDTFYAQCEALVPEDKQASLQAVRDGFLNALD